MKRKRINIIATTFRSSKEWQDMAKEKAKARKMSLSKYLRWLVSEDKEISCQVIIDRMKKLDDKLEIKRI
jgi:hypothetical protein